MNKPGKLIRIILRSHDRVALERVSASFARHIPDTLNRGQRKGKICNIGVVRGTNDYQVMFILSESLAMAIIKPEAEAEAEAE